LKDAATRTGWKESDLLRIARRGDILAWRIGRSWFTTIESVLARAGKSIEPTPVSVVTGLDLKGIISIGKRGQDVEKLKELLQMYVDGHDDDVSGNAGVKSRCRCHICKRARELLDAR